MTYYEYQDIKEGDELYYITKNRKVKKFTVFCIDEEFEDKVKPYLYFRHHGSIYEYKTFSKKYPNPMHYPRHLYSEVYKTKNDAYRTLLSQTYTKARETWNEAMFQLTNTKIF